MIQITEDIALQEAELSFEFVQGAGPGGQNVNKVATAAELRFDARHSPSLPEGTRQRLMKLAGKRLTAEGVVVIQARRYRTQEQNRQDAVERLAALIRQAATPPRKRKPTRPTQASQEKRLERKKRRGLVKAQRRGSEEW